MNFNCRMLNPKQLFFALKALGFNMTEKICEEFIESESADTNIK